MYNIKEDDPRNLFVVGVYNIIDCTEALYTCFFRFSTESLDVLNPRNSLQGGGGAFTVKKGHIFAALSFTRKLLR